MAEPNEGFFVFREYFSVLSRDAAMVLSFIRCRQAYCAQNKQGLPRFTNDWLADYFRCSPRQMTRYITACVKAGLLERIGNGKTASLFRVLGRQICPPENPRVDKSVHPTEDDTPEMSSLETKNGESETKNGDQLNISIKDISKKPAPSAEATGGALANNLGDAPRPQEAASRPGGTKKEVKRKKTPWERLLELEAEATQRGL